MSRTTGLESMLNNLNRQIAGIKKRSESGLMAGAHIIITESKKPINCPRDTGNLVNSAYVRKHPEKELLVEFGYHASYALFVHENLEQKLRGQPRTGSGAKGNYWDSGRPKFLEIPMAIKKNEVREVIRKAAKIK